MQKTNAEKLEIARQATINARKLFETARGKRGFSARSKERAFVHCVKRQLLAEIPVYGALLNGSRF